MLIGNNYYFLDLIITQTIIYTSLRATLTTCLISILYDEARLTDSYGRAI